ncbi:MAG: SDR family oxidoreductase [Chthoniobacteraceae bacterium]
MNLAATTILITGASSGLGAEFARQLAPRAKCLVLAARRVDRLDALAAEIAREGLVVRTLAVDLGDESDTERFLGELAALGIEVDVLINNAGVGDHGLFEASDWARVKAMVDVNVTALTRVTHALLPGMVARGCGAILNVSSIASLLPLPQMAVYAATKAYVTSLSEALRAELRGAGVNVTALCPGPVDTEFSAAAERPGSTGAQLAPSYFKVSAAQVVRDGLRAVEDDRARVIPGWFVFLTMTLTALVPFFVVRFALNRRGRGYTGH